MLWSRSRSCARARYGRAERDRRTAVLAVQLVEYLVHSQLRRGPTVLACAAVLPKFGQLRISNQQRRSVIRAAAAGRQRRTPPEPDRGRRNWRKNPEARDAVHRNRRRIRGPRGKRLLRQREELLERPCAHLYETGRMRRVHLRAHDNILKRLLIHVGACNPGLLMRQLFGIGTPRSLYGRAVALS